LLSIVVQHGSDGSIVVRPTEASQLAGIALLVLANLPAAFPVALFLLYPKGWTWKAVALVGGAGLAWVVLVTVWQALNQPWTIHADASRLWMVRRIWGQQTLQRGDLDAIVAASATYWYGKGSRAEPTYYFVDRRGQLAVGVKAGNYARADFEELARYLNVPLKGNFDRGIDDQSKQLIPEAPRH
jgi:hypothetical protein